MNTYTLLALTMLVATQAQAMKRTSDLTPEERAQKEEQLAQRMIAMRAAQEQRAHESQAHKEQELEERMAAMRLEQAARGTEYVRQDDQRGVKVTHNVKEVKGIGPVETTNISFGQDGLTIEDFKNIFKPQTPDFGEQLPNHLKPTSVIVSVSNPEHVAHMTKQGYLKKTMPNGLICFYLPGHETSAAGYAIVQEHVQNELKK